MSRITTSDLQVAVAALTERFHTEGRLHRDARFVVGGRNGYATVDITGGPHYGSGSSDLIIGTTRECAVAVWAIARAEELGRRSMIERSGV